MREKESPDRVSSDTFSDRETERQAEPVLIDQMREDDCPAVHSLLTECFSRPWSVKSLEEMFVRQGYHNLVARTDGRLTGYIGILAAGDQADIINVAVTAPFRRQGIGERLLSALLALAGEKGICQIFLEVRRSNRAAIRLYEQAGFARTGIRKDYYEEPVEDALIMAWDGQ